MELIHLEKVNSSTKEMIRKNDGRVNIVVLGDNLYKSDLEKFFGPLFFSDIFIFVEPYTTWAQILPEIGIFYDYHEACENGWNKPIKEGLTLLRGSGKLIKSFNPSIFRFERVGEKEQITPDNLEKINQELEENLYTQLLEDSEGELELTSSL